MELEDAVGQLYAVPPDAFTALRSELVAAARAGKDADLAKAVGALRKPSLPAWALNQLARRRPEALTALLDLGDRLRQAQSGGAGERLRELGRERTRIVADTATTAALLAADAGHPLSAAADRELQETLTAALSSPAAADAVASGSLTRALSYAGLGEVDLSDATAGRFTRLRGGGAEAPEEGSGKGSGEIPGEASGEIPGEGSADEVPSVVTEADSTTAEMAATRLRAAEEAATAAADRLSEARAARDDLAAQLDRAERRVEQLEQQLNRATEELAALTEEPCHPAAAGGS